MSMLHASAVPLIALLVLLGSAHAQEVSESAEKPADNSMSNFSFAAFSRAFGEAFAVILATEIGDRTFFIAAIMAMRHSRLIIWTGAVGALVVMTVLSTLVGHVAPLLISRTYTQYAAAGLFLFFGIKMLRSGLSIDHSGASDELEEVERELTKKEEDTPDDEESAPDKQDSKKYQETPNKVLIQAFTLTFLAEWGDRSQIATIALVRSPALPRTPAHAARPPALPERALRVHLPASALPASPSALPRLSLHLPPQLFLHLPQLSLHLLASALPGFCVCTREQAAAREPVGVTLGACIGHALCTGIAVIGGKLLASSIKERTVLLVGGALFCLFALLALLGAGE